MNQYDIQSCGATRINVGLSAIIKVAPGPNLFTSVLKIVAGGGTLEIVPSPIALSGSSAIGWGVGYPVGGTEIVSCGGPAVFYLAATGATMTVGTFYTQTVGASIL